MALNLGINLMLTEGIEHLGVLSGFAREEGESLQSFLRQPLIGCHLSKEQTLTLKFAHESLVFEVDQNEETGELYLAWTIGSP